MAVKCTPIPLRVRTNSVSALQNPVSALQNPFLGIALTKAQRHAKATQKKTLFKTKYLRCKAKTEAKGKAAYPDAGAKSCKVAYNKWQKHRGKAGQRAMKLAARLEKKGKYDPTLKAALDADMAAAMGEPSISPTMSDQQLYMMADQGAYDSFDDSGETTSPDYTMYVAAAGGLAIVGVVGFLLLRR